MIRHSVETVPDDLAALQERLDALAAGGAEIVTVLWQARRIEEEQSGAYDARGSFVIISREPGVAVLRERGAGIDVGAVVG
jgi:hypothetical protein